MSRSLIIGEYEGIPTDIGRNIDASLEQTVFAQEDVFVAVETHDRQGGLIITHEDDRTSHGRQRELSHRQRHGMASSGKAERAVHALDA